MFLKQVLILILMSKRFHQNELMIKRIIIILFWKLIDEKFVSELFISFCMCNKFCKLNKKINEVNINLLRVQHGVPLK